MAFYIFLFAFLIYNSFSYLDPDFGWHLRFGEIIWQTKTVPHDQIFMWPLSGDTWVDHEWLSNLAVFGLWSAGGYILITIVFALIPVTALWLINRQLISQHALPAVSQFTLAGLEVWAIIAMRPHFGIRIQELTFLFVSLLILTIVKVRATKNWTYALWLIPGMYVWSCLHAGFLIGLVIMAAWIGYELIIYWLPSVRKAFSESPLPRLVIVALLIISVLSFSGTWLTPYGSHLYEFLNDYRNNYYMDHIQEWRPPYVFPIHYLQISYNVLMISLAMGLVWTRQRKIPLLHVLLTLLFAALAFKSVRHFPLLAGVSLILIVPYALKELCGNLVAPKHSKSVAWITAVCLAALTIASLAGARYTTKPFSAYCQSYPCASLAFLKEHPQYTSGRLFNHYNFGGFTIGVQPDLRLFIDGRLPQYPFNGKTILEEYNRFNTKADASDRLSAYGITTVWYRKPWPTPKFNFFEYYVLGYRPKDFLDTSSPLLDYLASHEEWYKVYEDKLSIIYTRE